MKIHYLFSNRNKWGSKLIAWASSKQTGCFDEYPSHVAVLINEKLVVESVFGRGVRIIPYTKWKQINNEVYKIPCTQKTRSSQEITDEIDRIWGRPYDWKGIMFFTWAFLGFIIFNKPMPKKNKWQRNSHFFCTEFAGRIAGVNYEMTTPAKMLSEMLEK